MKSFFEFITELYQTRDKRSSSKNQHFYNTIHEDPSSAKSTGALALLNHDLENQEFDQLRKLYPNGTPDWAIRRGEQAKKTGKIEGGYLKLLVTLNNLQFLKDMAKQGPLRCEYCNEGPLVIYDIMKMPTEDELNDPNYRSNQEFKAQDGATCDHRVPQSKGGDKFDYSNLAVCCYSCNQKKKNMDYSVWLGSLNESAYDMILEANMAYSDDFDFTMKEILNSTSAGRLIAYAILQKRNKEVDINDNYLDISDNPRMLTFYPDDKIKKEEIVYKATQHAYMLNLEHEIIKELNIDTTDLIRNLSGLMDKYWRILETYLPKRNNLNVYLVQNIDNGEKLVCYSDIRYEGFIPCKTISTIKPTEVKVGRFINKFLSAIEDNFTEKEIEEFVNQYQATVEFKNNAYNNFKIVEGEEIRYWYNSDNNKGGGQLGMSCMNKRSCQPYFDIYCENPEVCKMLIFTQDNKLIGRALLWKLQDGKNYMDRVYTSRDNHMILFENWAKENNYLTYRYNSGTFRVNVIPKEYEYYPYMDTFSYYSTTDGILQSYTGSGLNGNVLELDCTAGGSNDF